MVPLRNFSKFKYFSVTNYTSFWVSKNVVMSETLIIYFLKNLILDKISAAVHKPSTLPAVASNIPHVHSNLHPDNLTLININNFKININFDICNVSQIGRYNIFRNINCSKQF